MNRIIIIIGGVIFLVLLLLVIFYPRPSKKSETGKTPVGQNKNTIPPQLALPIIPQAPQNVSLENLSQKDLPQYLPSYSVSGDLAVPFTVSQIQQIAAAFNFSNEPAKRENYGGGYSYIYNDKTGRVLAIVDNPPKVDFSELPEASGSKTLPSLLQAETNALHLVGRVLPSLSSGWEVKVIKSVYLSGGQSSAGEVADVSKADLANVTLGYFYNGLLVLPATANTNLISFSFGNNGAVVSGKVGVFVNNDNISLNPSGQKKAKTLPEVSASFYRGEARAISLGLSGVISDEPIIYPPAQVSAQDIRPVLLVRGDTLYPYYLIDSTGVLGSGRAGSVVYLLRQ